MKRIVIRPFTIPYQSSKFSIIGIHQGIMPTRVVFGFMRTKDFDPKKEDSYPFYFDHLNVKEINLKIASRSLPYSSALKFDYDNDSYLEGYNSLFKNIREEPNDITYKEYKSGYTLYAFDLTPDLCTGEHYSLLKDGSLDLEVTCGGLTESYTVIFYLEFDNILQITKERQVIVDYKV